MTDEQLNKILYILRTNHLLDEKEVVLEDNFTFIPCIELMRDANGEWINPDDASKKS